MAAIPGPGAVVPPQGEPASPSRKLGACGLGRGMWSHRGPWGLLDTSLLAADQPVEALRGTSRGCVQGRPALPPGPTGLLYQPARGLGPGSACACPATVLPGLSPGADPGAHSFSALGSLGPHQVLGVSASSGKNPKCCGQTRRGCAHSVSSPGESAGRAPRARPAAAQDQGRDAQAGQEVQDFDSALAARNTTPRLDEKAYLPWRPLPLPVSCGRLLRMGRL